MGTETAAGNTPEWLLPLAQRNDFVFTPSPRDFTVEEIPLYEASGEGEHLLLTVRKKGLSTWELIDRLSNHLGIPRREIGYAGLKDKHALTTQRISLPAKYAPELESFEHPSVKILERELHGNKLRIGHLKGNRFRLRFKKVLGVQREKVDRVLDWIEMRGMPNYFGLQRFGNDGTNAGEGRRIVHGETKMRDRKMREFLVSAYQSRLFNDWLSRRIALSRLLEEFEEREVERIETLPTGSLAGTKAQPHFFRILPGEIMEHYPYGRIFPAEDLAAEAEKFAARDRAPTGLLPGKRIRRAEGTAALYEAPFDDERIREQGSRRYAWVWPDEIHRRYVPEKAHYELSFTLPKGSYATVLVAMLRGSFTG
ncbi:tRNA pseudouridine(13) synthase TruD [Nitratifractor sp.]